MQHVVSKIEQTSNVVSNGSTSIAMVWDKAERRVREKRMIEKKQLSSQNSCIDENETEIFEFNFKNGGNDDDEQHDYNYVGDGLSSLVSKDYTNHVLLDATSTTSTTATNSGLDSSSKDSITPQMTKPTMQAVQKSFVSSEAKNHDEEHDLLLKAQFQIDSPIAIMLQPIDDDAQHCIAGTPKSTATPTLEQLRGKLLQATHLELQAARDKIIILEQRRKSQHHQQVAHQKLFLNEVGAIKQGIELWKKEQQLPWSSSGNSASCLEQRYHADFLKTPSREPVLKRGPTKSNNYSTSNSNLFAECRSSTEEKWYKNQIELMEQQFNHTARLLEETRTSNAGLAHENQILLVKISHLQQDQKAVVQNLLISSEQAMTKVKADVECEIKQTYHSRLEDMTMEKDCEIQQKEKLIQETRAANASLAHENATLLVKVSRLQQEHQTMSQEAIVKAKADVEDEIKQSYQSRLQEFALEKDHTVQQTEKLIQEIRTVNADLAHENETFRFKVSQLHQDYQLISQEAIAKAKADAEYEIKQACQSRLQDITSEKVRAIQQKEKLIQEIRTAHANLSHENENLTRTITHLQQDHQTMSQERLAKVKADVELKVKQSCLSRLQHITMEKDRVVQQKEELIQEIRTANAKLAHENETLLVKISHLQQDYQKMSLEAFAKGKADVKYELKQAYQSRLLHIAKENDDSIQKKDRLIQEVRSSNAGLARENEALLVKLFHLQRDHQALISQEAITKIKDDVECDAKHEYQSRLKEITMTNDRAIHQNEKLIQDTRTSNVGLVQENKFVLSKISRLQNLIDSKEMFNVHVTSLEEPSIRKQSSARCTNEYMAVDKIQDHHHQTNSSSTADERRHNRLSNSFRMDEELDAWTKTFTTTTAKAPSTGNSNVTALPNKECFVGHATELIQSASSFKISHIENQGLSSALYFQPLSTKVSSFPAALMAAAEPAGIVSRNNSLTKKQASLPLSVSIEQVQNERIDNVQEAYNNAARLEECKSSANVKLLKQKLKDVTVAMGNLSKVKEGGDSKIAVDRLTGESNSLSELSMAQHNLILGDGMANNSNSTIGSVRFGPRHQGVDLKDEFDAERKDAIVNVVSECSPKPVGFGSGKDTHFVYPQSIISTWPIVDGMLQLGTVRQETNSNSHELDTQVSSIDETEAFVMSILNTIQ